MANGGQLIHSKSIFHHKQDTCGPGWLNPSQRLSFTTDFQITMKRINLNWNPRKNRSDFEPFSSVEYAYLRE